MKCEERQTPHAGYTLSVDIIVQTVQAIGTTDDNKFLAYQDAWGINDKFTDPFPSPTPAPSEP